MSNTFSSQDFHIPYFTKKKKQEIGLSPDELIFRGQQKADEVFMRVIDYDAKSLLEKDIASVKELIDYQAKETVSWFNVDGLHDTKVMREIATVFNLDPIVIAEVLHTEARARVIEYDNCTLISLKMLRKDAETRHTVVENLSLILTKTVLISFQECKGDVFEPVRERIRKEKKRIRKMGIDYLTFALLDIVIDNYLYIYSLLGEKVELLEDRLLYNANNDVINEIYHHKRELNHLRKNINPAKEMIFYLAKMDSDFITDSVYVHYQELQDNISQANDTSNTYRDILSDQLNIYHTTISSKLNDVMKFLTVFSVIFIPLTLITGIYGTNFAYIPELSYHYSYYIMWMVMIVVTILMLIFFKRKKWL